MATIEDVARHVGISTATVSRVLNNTARVKADVAARVHSSVDALKYQPNRMARALRVHRSTVIGLLITNIENPFFTALVRGVEAAAQRNGYSVILCNSNEDPHRERQYVEVLCAERVAGAIVVPTHDRLRTMRLFRERQIPVVAVDRRIEDRHVDAVLVDNVRGARDAVAHLIANGYRRIGIITGLQATTTGRERLEGYRQALRDAGISHDPALERTGSFKDAQSGQLLASELLDLSPPPDALFVCNNVLTLGAITTIYARGMTIPGDIGLVCFDEMPWAMLHAISLTTVTQPVYELGSIAAPRLFQRLHDSNPFTRQEIVLAPTLSVRESSQPRTRESARHTLISLSSVVSPSDAG